MARGWMVVMALASISLPLRVAGQARLVLRDSIQLEQSAEILLSLPTTITADSAGYLIVDAQQPHVFEFDRDGSFLRRYAREGEGPGELKEVAAAVPYKLDSVMIFSWQPPAAQAFNRSTGEFVERFALTPPIESVVLRGDRVWVSGPRYSSGTGLRSFVLGEDSETNLGPLPAEFDEGGPLGGIFPAVSFTVWSDSVLIGFEPSNSLTLLLNDGTVLDTVDIPVERRRGVPTDPSAALGEALSTGPYATVFAVLSALRALHRNGDGTTTLVHFDSRPEGPPVTSEVFVSVLSRDRASACVDAQVPLGRDAQPAIGFDGDYLLVLEQVIQGFEAVPVLKRFEVDVTECGWTTVSQ